MTMSNMVELQQPVVDIAGRPCRFGLCSFFLSWLSFIAVTPVELKMDTDHLRPQTGTALVRWRR